MPPCGPPLCERYKGRGIPKSNPPEILSRFSLSQKVSTLNTNGPLGTSDNSPPVHWRVRKETGTTRAGGTPERLLALKPVRGQPGAGPAFHHKLSERVPRPCPCVLCRDKACPEPCRRGGDFDFGYIVPASGTSNSPLCRKRRDKGGAPSRVKISGKAGPAPLCGGVCYGNCDACTHRNWSCRCNHRSVTTIGRRCPNFRKAQYAARRDSALPSATGMDSNHCCSDQLRCICRSLLLFLSSSSRREDRGKASRKTGIHSMS
jgi:hypothetical protein